MAQTDNKALTHKLKLLQRSWESPAKQADSTADVRHKKAPWSSDRQTSFCLPTGFCFQTTTELRTGNQVFVPSSPHHPWPDYNGKRLNCPFCPQPMMLSYRPRSASASLTAAQEACSQPGLLKLGIILQAHSSSEPVYAQAHALLFRYKQYTC